MNNNDVNKYKLLLRFVFNVILIFILSCLFFNVWKNTYNNFLRNPYLMKGHYFMALVYAVIFVIMHNIFGGKRIGEYRLNNIIFSLMLSIFFTNILAYLALIVPSVALGFIAPMAMVYTTLKQILIIVFWAIICNYILIKIFPPSDMLLIYGNTYEDKLIDKFKKRNDIYNIKESIECNNNIDIIKNKCMNYNIIIVGDIDSDLRNELVKFCYSESKTIYILPKLSDIIIKNSENFYLFDSPLFISRAEAFPLGMMFLKRMFDIILSIIFIIVLFPLLLIVAICIKFTDFGPIFFIQERVTKDNKLFKIIKFRSMKVQDNSIVKPTTKDDDRITKIGQIIRRFHIDELPQLINVLIGDMSIVGPRPERLEHENLYSQEISEFTYRHKVKAGLTGLAQIYGKYNTTAYDKLKLDLIYIQNYSMLLDLEIIMKTIKVIFLKENTEGFTEKDSSEISEKIIS